MDFRDVSENFLYKVVLGIAMTVALTFCIGSTSKPTVKNVNGLTHSGDTSIEMQGNSDVNDVASANSNSIWLFARVGVDDNHACEALIRSTDNGHTWCAARSIIEPSFGYVYTGHIISESNKIHLSWTLFYTVPYERYNIYHAYLRTDNDSLYSMSGTNFGTSISSAEMDACMVVNTIADSTGTNQPSMQIDSNGYPWILYVREDRNHFGVNMIHWNGSAWTTPVKICRTDHQWNYSGFIISDSDSVDAFVTTAGGTGRGGDIDWYKWEGSKWTKHLTVLSEASSGRPLNSPIIPMGVNNEAGLIFCQIDIEDYKNHTLKVYSAALSDTAISEIIAENGVSQPMNFHNSPSAIYLAGKTYAVWQSLYVTYYVPFISVYDHATDIWATPVRIGSQGLLSDDHGAPSMCIDGDGHIHVFWGSQSSPILHAKSNTPENIGSWTEQKSIAGSYTYPQPITSKGRW